MLKKLTVLIASGVIASAGAAYAASFADIDADGDGMITQEELAAAYPDVEEETLISVDLNADGQITEDEHMAAVEDGLLPEATREGEEVSQ